MNDDTQPRHASSQGPEGVADSEVDGRLAITETSSDPLDHATVADSPALALGATALLPCEIWSTDFRERLAVGDPLRVGFTSSAGGRGEDSVKGLEMVHEVALQVTTIDR